MLPYNNALDTSMYLLYAFAVSRCFILRCVRDGYDWLLTTVFWAVSTARRTLHRRCTNGMRNGRITPVSGRWVMAVLPPVYNGSLTRKLLDQVARVRTIRPVRCCGMWCYVSRLGAFRRFLYGKAHRALTFGVSGKNYGSPSMPGIQRQLPSPWYQEEWRPGRSSHKERTGTLHTIPVVCSQLYFFSLMGKVYATKMVSASVGLLWLALVYLVRGPSRSMSPCAKPWSFACGEIDKTFFSAKVACQVLFIVC